MSVDEDQPDVLFRAKLQRENLSSWGFRLQGGLEYDTPLTLLKVSADSVAARCGLRAGDIVVRLCGQPADRMTHLMAQQTIASCGDTLEIIVERADVTSPVQQSSAYELPNNVDGRHSNHGLSGQVKVSDPVDQSRQRRRHSYDVNGTDGYRLQSRMVPRPRYEPAEEQRTISAQSVEHLADCRESSSSRTSADDVDNNDIPTTNDSSFRAARTSADSDRLLAPVEALVTTDAVTSLQGHHRHHPHHQQQQQHDDVTDTSDTASSVDDAASEMSDEEAASVIEVELGSTDHWSARPHTSSSSLPSNYILTANDSSLVHSSGDWSAVSSNRIGPPTSPSSLPSNYAPASDDSASRDRTEYIKTAPWRCLPVRHRASVGSYSDPDIASSAAAVSDFEQQRLARARERRHLARSVDVSQMHIIPNRLSLSTSITHVQPTPVASRLQPTTVNNNNKQQRQHFDGVVVSRNNYVPQKPPPPLPMPDNDLVKQLRPVQTSEDTVTSSSSSSSSTREQQKPVRQLVAQLSGQMPSSVTTTTVQLPQQQQQQQRRQQRRQQLQLLHGRPLSSLSSDAEADYEIFINTPPAGAAGRDADKSIRGWTERLLSAASRKPPPPPSASASPSASPSSSSSSSSLSPLLLRRTRRPVITPTVSYHSTATYRPDFDLLSRRYSLPTSTAAVHSLGPTAALQRKVRFAEPPESSVIEIESRRRRGDHTTRTPRRSSSSTASSTTDDWLMSASDTEYSSASSLTEKLDRLELENALASAAMKRSRPFHHHQHQHQHQPPQLQQPPPQYDIYQQPHHNIDNAAASFEQLSRKVQGRARLEPIEERVVPIQRLQQQQQQQADTTTDISRHYAMYRRRASNVEPTLSSLSSLSESSSLPSSQSLIVGGADLSSGFCVSVGRHSRGFSLSVRPQQLQQQQQQRQDQQRPLVSVVIPTADASLRQLSPRQPSPSNSIINIHDSQSSGDVYHMDYRSAVGDDQPSRYTIYQPLLATGRTSTQQFYDPRRSLLVPPSASPSALYNDADDVTSSLSSSSSSSSPWLSTSHQLVSSRQLSPSTGQPSFPRSTSPPRQPLPDGWIISPQQHQQQQQQPTAESMHVVHNMSGILAFFDKSFTEKVLNWPTQQTAEPSLVESETYKLVREMDEEQHRMDSS